MAIVDLVMPKLGESIMEATILRWNKKPGDHVNIDETILEIATDKVDSEVPSSVEGTIIELLYNENDVVPVDTIIARIQSNSTANNSNHAGNGVSAVSPATSTPVLVEEEKPVEQEVPYQPSNIVAKTTGGARFYSPLVLNIAANEGVSLADLEHNPGTGNDGRVTKKDILQWIASGGKKTMSSGTPEPAKSSPADTVFQSAKQLTTQPTTAVASEEKIFYSL